MKFKLLTDNGNYIFINDYKCGNNKNFSAQKELYYGR